MFASRLARTVKATTDAATTVAATTIAAKATHPNAIRAATQHGSAFYPSPLHKQDLQAKSASLHLVDVGIPVKRHRGEPGHTRDTRDLPYGTVSIVRTRSFGNYSELLDACVNFLLDTLCV